VAKRSASTNGQSHLEEAMALLIQNQASFLKDLRDIERDRRDMERANSDRFSRIEATMASILRVLDEHSRTLERLPEAVRDKIGFKGQP
jgi:hypothetical protein